LVNLKFITEDPMRLAKIAVTATALLLAVVAFSGAYDMYSGAMNKARIIQNLAKHFNNRNAVGMISLMAHDVLVVYGDSEVAGRGRVRVLYQDLFDHLPSDVELKLEVAPREWWETRGNTMGWGGYTVYRNGEVAETGRFMMRAVWTGTAWQITRIWLTGPKPTP
jgi:hypothetical protein